MSLHLEAAPPELVTLLRRLMSSPALGQFQLVGGTALALRFGHRISVDIDLFTLSEFDAESLENTLITDFQIAEATREENSISGEISGIKIDCLAHRYPEVRLGLEIEGIRFAATEDIAAMKLNAITNRGSKKDFWDYHELLRHHTKAEMLSFYQHKYPAGSQWHVEKSLSYFEDADHEPDPRDLRGLSWEEIKAGIARSNRL